MGLEFDSLLSSEKFTSATIKTLFTKSTQELPFWGFKSTTNAQDQEPLYWFNKLFTSLEHPVCPSDNIRVPTASISRNLHIEGKLSKFMFHLTKFNEKNSSGKGYFKKTREWLVGKVNSFMKLIPPEVEELHVYINKEAIPLRELLRAKPCPEEIEIAHEGIEKGIAIIKGISVDRGLNVTCPVQTLMLFVANEKVEFEEEVIKLFNDVRSEEEFAKCYEENEDLLPRIFQSNVKYLSQVSERKLKVKEGVKMVIFENKGNNLNKRVRPVCWIHFSEEFDAKDFQGNTGFEYGFEGENYAFGGFVVVKLINQYNNGESELWNIDIQHFTLRGDILYV